MSSSKLSFFKPQRWKAFFFDYRNLNEGYLYDVDQLPKAVSGMSAEFEVVNAMFYDDTREQLKTVREDRDRLLKAAEFLLECKAHRDEGRYAMATKFTDSAWSNLRDAVKLTTHGEV